MIDFLFRRAAWSMKAALVASALAIAGCSALNAPTEQSIAGLSPSGNVTITEDFVAGMGGGAGIGASHQTGWTGLVAPLIEIFGRLDAKTFLEAGRAAAFEHEHA